MTQLTPEEETKFKLTLFLVLPPLFVFLAYLAGAFVNLEWFPSQAVRMFMVLAGISGFFSALILCL